MEFWILPYKFGYHLNITLDINYKNPSVIVTCCSKYHPHLIKITIIILISLKYHPRLIDIQGWQIKNPFLVKPGRTHSKMYFLNCKNINFYKIIYKFCLAAPILCLNLLFTRMLRKVIFLSFLLFEFYFYFALIF